MPAILKPGVPVSFGGLVSIPINNITGVDVFAGAQFLSIEDFVALEIGASGADISVTIRETTSGITLVEAAPIGAFAPSAQRQQFAFSVINDTIDVTFDLAAVNAAIVVVRYAFSGHT